MKKTTKKLISTFLALVMMLTIIPMGTMTAFAINASDVCVCGHPAVEHYGTYYVNCNAVGCSGSMCSAGGFTYPDPINYTRQITLDGKDYLYDSKYVTNYGSSLYCDIHKELAHKYSEWEAPSGDGYSKCLEAGHIKEAAPEWLETIVAKVDACSDELVADVEGTPATLSDTIEGIAGGAFGDFVDAMNKKEYSQDDSVYTIEGELGSSILTVDVTLDANEDVVSVKIVAVNEGVEYINYTFEPVATADFTASHFFCSVCKSDGKSFIANYSGDVQDHYMSAHEDDIIAAMDCTHECILANPCGDENCPNTPKQLGESATCWTLVNGVLTISGTGATPDCSNQNPAPWTDKKDDITSVVIENGVTTIGKYLFKGCANVISATIPSSVTSILESAFMGCEALASLTIPNGVQLIGINAFQDSGLTSVSIPNSVTSIGNGAFHSCGSLVSVTLPTGITSIANYTFQKCSSLTSITIPNGVTSIGSSAFAMCGNLASVTLPSSLTSIGMYAFEECEKLTKVTLPSSGLTIIRDNAFVHCTALTNFTIPSTVTEIGGSAFRNCSSLTNITIPSTVTSIGKRAFEKCSKLASVVVNAKDVPTLGSTAFNDCASELKIYVPSESVADYKTNWADYEDKIEAIKTPAPSFPVEEEKKEEEKQEEPVAPAPVTEETFVTKAIVPSKSKIKVTVNKVDGVDGYQIQYGRVKSFKKSKKTITTKKTVKTIKVKKPGKKYYVRVRSFKMVDGKKVYSKWSKIKSIKTM